MNTCSYLISLDPGATTGWAIFRYGILIACGRCKHEQLHEKLEQHWSTDDALDTLVVVEHPVIYPGGKAEVPDNDIVVLGVRAGELKGPFDYFGCHTKYVKPRNWKGTLPKAKKGQTYIIEKRVLKMANDEEKKLIYSTMSARAKHPDHNMIDAIGIGMNEQGRIYQGEAI